MLITKIVGGLGNQMFQYAMAKAFSLKYNVQLKIDCSSFNNKNYINEEGYLLKKVFGIPENEANINDYFKTLGFSTILLPLIRRNILKSLYKRVIFFEKKIFHFDEDLKKGFKANGYIHGYWQSEKYFSQYANIICNIFKFKHEVLSTNCKNYIQTINDKNSISLHIRRGDYISNPIFNQIYNICDVDYYQNAIKFMQNKIANPHFFVFTDDISWTMSRPEFLDRTKFTICSDGSESWNDLYLMSLCKHNIIANSSFSWWGAWLNSNLNKIVISPKLWFKNGTEIKDLLPQKWVSI